MAPVDLHSDLSASMGSTAVARMAGTSLASTVAAISVSDTVAGVGQAAANHVRDAALHEISVVWIGEKFPINKDCGMPCHDVGLITEPTVILAAAAALGNGSRGVGRRRSARRSGTLRALFTSAIHKWISRRAR